MHEPEKKFRELTDRFFDWYWENHPVDATATGIHCYDHRLPDFSPEGIEGRKKAIRTFLKDLAEIEEDDLTLDYQIDYKLLNSQLKEMKRDAEELQAYKKRPDTYLQNGLSGIYLLVIRNFAPLEKRMRSIKERMEEYCRLLEEGCRQLDNPPPVFIETELLSLPGTIGFFRHILPQLAEETPELKEEIDQGCEKVINSLENYGKYLEELKETASGEFAVGKDIFDRMLKEDHFLDYNWQTLLEKGKELVEETENELEHLAREIDPEKKWKDIIAETKIEHPPEGELLDFYRQESEKVKDFVARNKLVDLPQGDLVIEDTPEPFRPVIPYAAYLPPAPLEEEQIGRFYVTPVDPDKSPEDKEAQLGEHSRYSVPITVLHEGYPGHHLQLCYSNKAPSLLKKTVQSTLFVEGWAFYCEELMEQQGYLDDPRYRLNRLKDQLWRACRIVVDVSLHTGQMDFEQAVDYLVEVALLERNSAVTEVRRYTASPTQPMSYLIGKLEILNIVDRYRRHKGEDFDLKQFHQEILNYGSLPPALISKVLFNDKD
ncbi:MAG: DUF885 domain-containing protein [Bacillota bacterium]